MDLRPKGYAPDSDGGTPLVRFVHAHTRMTVSIARNSCEDALELDGVFIL